MRLVGGAKDSKPVIAEFDAIPIAEALHRLLGQQNFTLVYGKSGKLSRIRLAGGPVESPPVPARVPPPGPAAPASPVSLVGLIESHPPLPVAGRLSQVLGSPTATFRQLFEVATRNEEVPLRNESVRVILNALETETELRSQVITSLKTLDDATAGQLLRGAAGDRAEEVLIHAATLARSTELRVKASSVLQQMRTQTPGG